MRGDGISIQEIIRLGKREKVITQGLIALWIDKGGMTPYLIFKQIKELCQLGILDNDKFTCKAYKDKIVFVPKNIEFVYTKVNKTNSSDMDNMPPAAPSEPRSKSVEEVA